MAFINKLLQFSWLYVSDTTDKGNLDIAKLSYDLPLTPSGFHNNHLCDHIVLNVTRVEQTTSKE